MLLSFVLFVQGVIAANVAAPDSISSTQLDEVVVNGQTQWMDHGKAVFIPTKQSKRLAGSMESMLEIINPSMLKIQGANITTSTGEPVVLFINGVPVDNLDRSTFWANNVIRIEYFPQTDDPVFLGKRNVLNFVMKEYAVGGLTRMSGYQVIPNSGDYDVSSKLVYKKMTYNVKIGGGYSRDYWNKTQTTETFEDVWYADTHHDVVDRQETSDAVDRTNSFTTAANARYKSDKFITTHSIAFDWNQNPHSAKSGGVAYSPTILPDGEMTSLSVSRASSIRLNGEYLPRSAFRDKWYATLNWQARYNHNIQETEYAETGEYPILNNARENAWSFGVSAGISYQINQNGFARLNVGNSYEKFKTTYGGSVSSLQDMGINNTSLGLQLNYRISSKVFMQLHPSLGIYDRRVNDSFSQTDVMPGINGRVGITTHQCSYLSLSMNYGIIPPASSECNELIIRQSELKWIEGNPGIKPNNMYGTHVGFSWTPSSRFSLDSDVGWSIDDGDHYIAYRSGGTEYDGIVGQYVDGLTQNLLSTNLNISYTPIMSVLQLHAGLEYRYNEVRGVRSIHAFRPDFRANLYFSDFSLNMYCSAPQKLFRNAGTDVLKTSWGYGVGLNYGNGNLMLGLRVNNPFEKYRHETTTTQNGPYTAHTMNWSRGRDFVLNLTYYFDYGKKTDTSINIDEGDAGSSSILGSHTR